MKDSNSFDILIIGAGIAGLYTALRVLERAPKTRLAIVEKYKDLGGRALTFHGELPNGTPVQWEIGAGRISKEHTMLLSLVKRQKLTAIPIGSQIDQKEDGESPQEPNQFEASLPALLSPLRALPTETLATHTLGQLLTQIHGFQEASSFLNRFPQRAEIHTLRADLALETFSHEMKGHEGYFVLKEGFSELVKRMADDIKERGGKIFVQHEVTQVHYEHGRCRLTVKEGSFLQGANRLTEYLEADKVVFALEADALRKLAPFQGWKTLSHLRMMPLCRIYAVFPKQGKKVWFHGLPRVVSTTRARQFLPIDSDVGSAMISQTDSQDATPLMELEKRRGADVVVKQIVEDLRDLFPDRTIPDPIFSKVHPWEGGATQWLPGQYSPASESRKAWKPFAEKPFQVCGESQSLRQAWVEGALEHADGMVKLLLKKGV